MSKVGLSLLRPLCSRQLFALDKRRFWSLPRRRCTTVASGSSTKNDVTPGANESNANAKAGANKAPVKMTDRCVQKLTELTSGENEESLRLTVDGGGCSGFEYKFSLHRGQPSPDDLIVQQNGAKLLVDQLSAEFVRGATIDYCEELIRAGFKVVDNPLAMQGCSCGASFAPRMD